MKGQPGLERNRPLIVDLAEGTAFKCVGAGGTGGIVNRYGVLLAASAAEALGRNVRWLILDGDRFEPANRSRMFFKHCGNKAAVLRDELLPYVADTRLTLSAIEEFVTPDNIGRLFHDGDVILLAVDNHATRKLVSDFCAQRLANVCLISGGNDGAGDDSSGTGRRGTYGNCQVFLKGKYESPSLTEYHDEIENPADHLPSEPDCLELLATNRQSLAVNLWSAAAMLGTLWLYLCGELHYSELAFDVADGLVRPLDLPPPRRSGASGEG